MKSTKQSHTAGYGAVECKRLERMLLHTRKIFIVTRVWTMAQRKQESKRMSHLGLDSSIFGSGDFGKPIR